MLLLMVLRSGLVTRTNETKDLISLSLASLFLILIFPHVIIDPFGYTPKACGHLGKQTAIFIQESVACLFLLAVSAIVVSHQTDRPFRRFSLCTAAY